MRAWLYDVVGGPLGIRAFPDPACPPGGAVVEVRATGVCRSDWHAWRGHDPVPLPMVPGHEFAGVVVDVGPEVRAFRPGQRVTAPFVNGCGRCRYCHDGQAQVCPDQTQPGFTHPGSFAERVVVRQADLNLVALPDAVDFVTAASLGCRFATAYHALTAQARLTGGETLVVFGCGGVGLSAIEVATALGVRVIAVDPSPAAREMAVRLGADAVPDHESAGAVIDGGADVTLDAFGSAATAVAAVRSLRRRGRHVQAGLMLGDDALAPLPWAEVVAKELQVAGAHGMAAADYPEMLGLVTSGRLRPERLVGSVIGFEGLGAALEAMDGPGGAGMTVAAWGEA